MSDIPVVVTSAGAQPTLPSVLLADLIAGVVATNPGYTATLPASMVEDISSTAVGALVIIDAARVETINSLTPYGANDFLLAQLGQQFIGPGSAPAPPTNTSVFVTFTCTDNSDNPLPGQVIDVGFTVSDGTYQYIVQDGGVTDSSGVTVPLFCLATSTGTWAVPTQSVSQIVTSPPTNVNIACSNPEPGTPGTAAAETAAQYRARVLTAEQAICTGLTTTLKTLLGQVSGVQQRLISTIENGDGTWTVISGGGDPYLTAGAIFKSGLNIATLEGATLAVSGITQANPGVVTTSTNHNLATGDQIQITGIVGMTELNGVEVAVTVITEKTFSIAVNTSGYVAYVSGGVVSPNPIAETPAISDPPNVYTIPYVNPPAQTVTIAVSYTTTVPNFASQAAVSQAVAPAISSYLNSILVGAPISDLLLRQTFAIAVQPIVDPSLISSLTFEVSINDVPTSPVGDYYESDPYSYFSATSSNITVVEA